MNPVGVTKIGIIDSMMPIFFIWIPNWLKISQAILIFSSNNVCPFCWTFELLFNFGSWHSAGGAALRLSCLLADNRWLWRICLLRCLACYLIFPFESPFIESIELNKVGKVRRARIFYLRELSGKKARIKEKKVAVVKNED